MASSINDLERLSLDLPDVVVEAEKVEKPKRGRGRRCLRRNLQKSQPQSQQSQQQGGARALTPVEDKRVPDSSIVEAVQEPKPKPEPNDRGPPIQGRVSATFKVHILRIKLCIHCLQKVFSAHCME